LGRGPRLGRRILANLKKTSHRLRLAIFFHGEVRLLQIVDRPAFVVGNRHIDHGLARRNPEGRRNRTLCSLRWSRSTRALRRTSAGTAHATIRLPPSRAKARKTRHRRQSQPPNHRLAQPQSSPRRPAEAGRGAPKQYVFIGNIAV
jgi:hypothetical protein